ncbi:hypothetical protein CDD81_5308 [Ophiocordyceps australis]|uniref:OTU domain-containing protein n=1 Tax=Ophiocordyceps australis TaxID=1399860 RepID=A0A2C5YGX1_9HYPO|nr:hypothetical protein CDD81_5308 [Ophiocordyceps australis]
MEAKRMQESTEQMQARHQREQEALQTRTSSKKRNASKKTRKGVMQECERLERELRERQDKERASAAGEAGQEEGEEEEEAGDADGQEEKEAEERVAAAVDKLRHAQDELVTATQGMELRDRNGHGQDGLAGGKKRNRQRERLARRAAAQEAAACAAEEEASQMTNHRSLEAEAMQQAMTQHGLVEVQVPPDGHCLFSAVADQLDDKKISLCPLTALSASAAASATTTTAAASATASAATATATATATTTTLPPYKTLRRAAAEYMLAHADDFAPYLDDGDDLASYAARMRDTAEWGGHMELLALARTYDALICVLHDGRIERVGGARQKGEEKALWLAYYRHGFGLGAHYNSLRSKTA